MARSFSFEVTDVEPMLLSFFGVFLSCFVSVSQVKLEGPPNVR